MKDRQARDAGTKGKLEKPPTTFVARRQIYYVLRAVALVACLLVIKRYVQPEVPQEIRYDLDDFQQM